MADNAPFIIAISGKAGAGKTFFARSLASHSNRCSIVSFASPIKDICSLVFGDSQYFTEKKHEDFISINDGVGGYTRLAARDIMQRFGDALRGYDEDFFVKLAVNKIIDNNMKGLITCIDDLRFPNELKGIRDVAERFDVPMIHFHVIRSVDEALNEEQSNHVSESYQDVLAEASNVQLYNLNKIETDYVASSLIEVINDEVGDGI